MCGTVVQVLDRYYVLQVHVYKVSTYVCTHTYIYILGTFMYMNGFYIYLYMYLHVVKNIYYMYFMYYLFIYVCMCAHVYTTRVTLLLLLLQCCSTQCGRPRRNAFLPPPQLLLRGGFSRGSCGCFSPSLRLAI